MNADKNEGLLGFARPQLQRTASGAKAQSFWLFTARFRSAHPRSKAWAGSCRITNRLFERRSSH